MSLEIVEFLKKVISLLVNVAPWTVVIFAFAIFYPKFRGIRRGPLRKTLLACFIVLVPLFFLMVSYFVQFTFWEAINWLLPLIACLPWCAVCLWLWLVFCKFGSFWKGFQNKFTLILASFFFAAVIFSLAIELAQPFDLQRYPERNTLLGHLALSLQLAFRDAFHILSGDGEELYALVQEIQFRTPGYKVTVWILSVTLPLLTVSYLLSTVSILWEILSIGNPRNQKFYIFSEANAQSICMAHSIHEREKKKKTYTARFLFLRSPEHREDLPVDIARELEDISYALFAGDEMGILETLPSIRKKTLSFYFFCEDAAQNFERANHLLEWVRLRCKSAPPKANLYVQSEDPSGDALIDSLRRQMLNADELKKGRIRREAGFLYTDVHLIQPTRAMCNSLLQEKPLFPITGKTQTVLVLGLGFLGRLF